MGASIRTKRARPGERDFNALSSQSWRMRYEPTADANLGEVVPTWVRLLDANLGLKAPHK